MKLKSHSFPTDETGRRFVFVFPYRIGIPTEPDRMCRRWRPGDTGPLTGDLSVNADPYGTIDKLRRLGERCRAARLDIVHIDVADQYGDVMEVSLPAKLEHAFKDILQEVFCLDMA